MQYLRIWSTWGASPQSTCLLKISWGKMLWPPLTITHPPFLSERLSGISRLGVSMNAVVNAEWSDVLRYCSRWWSRRFSIPSPFDVFPGCVTISRSFVKLSEAVLRIVQRTAMHTKKSKQNRSIPCTSSSYYKVVSTWVSSCNVYIFNLYKKTYTLRGFRTNKHISPQKSIGNCVRRTCIIHQRSSKLMPSRSLLSHSLHSRE